MSSPVSRLFPAMPKIKSIAVTIEMEDGRVETVHSHPGRIVQQEGVRIDTDVTNRTNDIREAFADMHKITTVTWHEQWIDMVR